MLGLSRIASERCNVEQVTDDVHETVSRIVFEICYHSCQEF